MTRSFTNRLFGGVCGGLSQRTPIGVTLWRTLFVILTPLTVGVAGLAYLVLWWLWPLEIPGERRHGSLGALIGLLLASGLIAAGLLRGTLNEAIGADVLLPLALVVVAFVFFIRQFAGGRRGNIMLGLVALVLAIVLLLLNLGQLPVGIADVVGRAWPGVLVVVGLSILLRDRIALGNWFALGLGALVVAGVALSAYSVRIEQVRTENEVTYTEAVSDAMTTLQINLVTLESDIQVATTDEREVRASFVGSPASVIEQTFVEDAAGIATFTLQESRPEAFPPLDEIGRGTLRLELPPDLALAVSFASQGGAATFDMNNLDLERLKLLVNTGDVLVTLPDYQPRSPSVVEDPGTLTVRNGDLRVRVPRNVGARFVLDQAQNRQPVLGEDYDDLYYALELRVNEWVLVARDYDDAEVQITYVVSVPNGRFRLDVVE